MSQITAATSSSAVKPSRFLALDAFRGLTVAFMILVNTPGDWGHVYAPLLHAPWFGWTATDLVFPFFLFMVGCSAYFALKKYKFQASRQAVNKIIKRSVLMFAIGLSLNAYNYILLDGDALRIMGVLQRIALCYLVGALLILYCSTRSLYIVSAVILVGYYCFFLLFGGQAPFAFDNNLIGIIDKVILGEAHMWKMHGVAFDPEGLLSSFPAVVSMLLGFETTRLLTSEEINTQVIKKLCIYAVSFIVLAYAVSMLMPISKNLWSVSYVLLTTGIALLVLALCVWLIDIKGFNFILRPLEIIGSNPLFIYALSWLVATTFWAIPINAVDGSTTLYTYLWQSLLPWFSNKGASLVFATLHVLFFWLVSYGLYKRNIFIKI